jgi:hypothetical protein
MHIDWVSTWTIVGFILRMLQNIVSENSLAIVPHPPYSSDLTSSDFGFPVMSGHLVQVVYLTMSVSFVRLSLSSSV